MGLVVGGGVWKGTGSRASIMARAARKDVHHVDAGGEVGCGRHVPIRTRQLSFISELARRGRSLP